MPSLRSGITSGLGLCIRPYRYASQLVRRYYFEGFSFNISKNDLGGMAQDTWGILKMTTVKSVQPGNSFFGINHIIRCGSKLTVGICEICLDSYFMII